MSAIQGRKVQSVRACGGRIQVVGGKSSFRFPGSNRVGALGTRSVNAHTACQPAPRSTLGVDPNLNAVDNTRPNSPKETRLDSQKETRSS